MDYKVIHDKEEQKFQINIEEQEAYLRYLISNKDNTINFLSTYTPPALRGNGLAEKIVKEGFKFAEENNLKVIPTCPYIHTFLKRNPEYDKLIV